jgi:penicillin-binding protein 1A
MSKLNPYTFKKLLHQFGLLNKEIEPTPSLCLGACDASISEMVSAYSAFVGKGVRTSPLMVTRIEDNAGNTISTFSARKTEVISARSSYKMIDMLRGVINGGTGSRVRRVYGITVDAGGKTGTTQNNSDGWFMGFTPSLVTGCWVGGEERDIHFDRMIDGQGSSSALPIWGLYMKKVFEDKTLPYSQEERFDIPKDFDPCGGSLLYDEGNDGVGQETEESDGFDELFQ